MSSLHFGAVSRTLVALAASVPLLGGCGGKRKVVTIPFDPDPVQTASGRGHDDGADRSGTATVAATGAGSESTPSFGPVRFEFDSTLLSGDGRRALQRLANWLEHTQAHVTIEGHADDRGTTEYNLALGQRRAAVIADYLAHLGVARSRLTTISYGEEQPAARGDDEGAWAENRRGELRPDR